MEGEEGHPGSGLVAERLREALAHLVRGLASERDSQDGVGIDAEVEDQMGDAADEDARLPAPCARGDEDGPGDGEDRLALLLVERGQDVRARPCDGPVRNGRRSRVSHTLLLIYRNRMPATRWARRRLAPCPILVGRQCWADAPRSSRTADAVRATWAFGALPESQRMRSRAPCSPSVAVRGRRSSGSPSRTWWTSTVAK